MKLPVEGLHLIKYDNNAIMPHERKKIWELLLPVSNNKYEFESAVSWVRMDKRGSFTVRLASYLYERYRYKNQDMIQAIGNVLGQQKVAKYYLDFDTEFQWIPGDFADAGSCLWMNDRVTALSDAQHNGIFAMRIFAEDPESNGYFYPGLSGVGRCFIYPYGEEEYIVLNGYIGGRDTYLAADLLQQFLGYQFQSKLSNLHFDNNTRFYTNGVYILLSQVERPVDYVQRISFYSAPVYKDLRMPRCVWCRNVVTKETQHSQFFASHIVHKDCCYWCTDCFIFHILGKTRSGSSTGCGRREYTIGDCHLCGVTHRLGRSILKGRESVYICMDCFNIPSLYNKCPQCRWYTYPVAANCPNCNTLLRPELSSVSSDDEIVQRAVNAIRARQRIVTAEGVVGLDQYMAQNNTCTTAAGILEYIPTSFQVPLTVEDLPVFPDGIVRGVDPA